MAEIRINGKKLGLVNGKKVRAIHYGLKTWLLTQQLEEGEDIFEIRVFSNSTATFQLMSITNNEETITIDWGDGEIIDYTISPINWTTCTKNNAYPIGYYTIKIYSSQKFKINTIDWGSIGPTSISFKYFKACGKLSSSSSYSHVLTNVNLGEIVSEMGVTSIPNDALSYCTGLTNITFPNGLTEIQGKAFYQCSSLTSLSFPKSVKEIGSSAFMNNVSVKSISFEEGILLTTFNYRSFSNTQGITELIIPNTITTIGGEAFYNAKSLVSVFVPKSVVKIGGSGLWVGSANNKATIVFESETPCALDIHSFFASGLQEIRVPASAVEAYKSATNWSAFADYIVGY